MTDACKGHATVKTCYIIPHVCSLRDRGGVWDLSQRSIFGAKSKNRILDIQRLTDSQTFEKATLRQNPFPSFTQWAYTNASDDERSLDGFALWGQWARHPEETVARHFYITLATHAEHWSGHLTIGQHYYFWTSADVGDAHLLDTEECATLEEAIVALKAEMARLCRAWSLV